MSSSTLRTSSDAICRKPEPDLGAVDDVVARLAESENSEVVFVSWAENCSRSDNIARELGGKSYMVYFGFFGSNYLTILLKYFCQAVATLRILFRDRPRIVLCMSPPVPALVPVWAYCLFDRRRKYVIDYHTAAFVIRINRWLYPLQRFFARRAALNLVTNEALGAIVRGWGGRVQIVGDVRVVFREVSRPGYLSQEKFNVVFVSRYAGTEPLGEVFAAARELRDEGVQIFVTGSLKDAPASARQHPDNVTLTDFLSDADYAGLLAHADAALCLCTNDNTMQRGAYEAMAVETPLVISNWRLLRETFSSGALYVDNSAAGISRGIREMRADIARHRTGIRELKERRAHVWEATVREIRRCLGMGTMEDRA